jgi:hypothetical protein
MGLMIGRKKRGEQTSVSGASCFANHVTQLEDSVFHSFLLWFFAFFAANAFHFGDALASDMTNF